jgi:hypothetical protein
VAWGRSSGHSVFVNPVPGSTGGVLEDGVGVRDVDNSVSGVSDNRMKVVVVAFDFHGKL